MACDAARAPVVWLIYAKKVMGVGLSGGGALLHAAVFSPTMSLGCRRILLAVAAGVYLAWRRRPHARACVPAAPLRESVRWS